MALFLLLCVSTFISCLLGAEDVKQGSNILTVYPVTTAGQLVRRMDETLNLTCSVTGNSSHMSKFKITWELPYSSKNSISRVYTTQEHNKLTLSVQKLQESDSGDYKCQAIDNNQTSLQEVVRVNVKRRKPVCSENMFQCALPGGECIAKRYVCDGWQDCPEGADEAAVHCGRDACEGKLRCENGRCIPYEWCCDDYVDPNCTVKVRLPCCRKLVTGCVLCAAGDMDADGYPPSEQQRFNDMGFLQTTIYTVIGCAMAFMFIVTVLVIAICRVHMKRTVLSRCPGAVLASRAGASGSFPPHPGSGRLLNLPRSTVPPLYDLDVFLSRSAELSQPNHSGLLVTYNINNGVQFVGRPVEPPPYSEVVPAPPREGPPPPYTSTENLAQISADHEECEDNSGEGDRLLGNCRINHSPIIRSTNSMVQVVVENSGETDTLLNTPVSSVVMPSYATTGQVAVVNPLRIAFNLSEGANEPDSSCTESPDFSGNNSSSLELTDQPSSSPSDSSIGQTLPCDTSPNGDEYMSDCASNILSSEACSGDQDHSDQLCNNCSSNSSLEGCLGKMKQQNVDCSKESLNSNLSRPVDASHCLTTSSSTCKISARQDISDSPVEPRAISGFADCETGSLNGVSEESKPWVLKSENT